jgi:hypothetical protein
MPLGSAGSRGHLPDLVPGSILWVADGGRALLEKLADAGKPTELGGGEAIVGKTLERAGLVLFTRNSASAVITPKGRHAITAVKFALKPASPKKPPLGFGS